MAKLILYFLFNWLLVADCRNHNQQYQDSSQTQHARSLENYLKTALEKLKLDSIEANNFNSNRETRTNNQENGNAAEKHHSLSETTRIQSKRAEVGNRGYNEKPLRKNSVSAVTPARHGIVPWYKNINVAHRPAVSPKTTSLLRTTTKATVQSTAKPSNINIPSWKKIKRIIQKEFNRDYANLRKMREKIVGKWDRKVNRNKQNADDDDKWRKRPSEKKPHNQGTRFWSKSSSLSITDGKNWLVFGIGVGCTVMLFMAFVLGYHCVRYIKHKDGLFAKTDRQTDIHNPPRCRNNNNYTGKGDFLTRHQVEEQGWSSEEEVFNVSIPRSFHESLPNSPAASKHSTPIKNRKTLLK